MDYRKQINPLNFFEHFSLQEDFHNDLATTKGLFGGNRSGKTEEGAHYVITKCLDKPFQKWWACAEDFNSSVQIQQKKIWDLVPKNEIKYGFYDPINGFTNRKLLFKNGSSVFFKSYDQDVETFASEDLDGIWNDEEPPYSIYKEQRMRLIDRNGEMIFTMTSLKGITELLEEIFENHEVVKFQNCKRLNKDLPRIIDKNGMRFYMLWTTENEYIDQIRLSQEMHLMTEQEILSRIFGIPINLSGKIYSLNRNIHVVPLERVPNDCSIYHILDPHDRKPWAMIWVAIDKTDTSYVIDEYPNKNFNEMFFDDKTYTDYGRIIREKEVFINDYFGHPVDKRIIDPNFGNKTVQLAERQGGQSTTTPKRELQRLGFNFVDGIDALEAGHLKVRENLHYELKGDEIVVQPKLFITDFCQNTIMHLIRYSRKDINLPDGDVKDRAQPMQKYKDFCDLVRYYSMSNPQYLMNFSGIAGQDMPHYSPRSRGR